MRVIAGVYRGRTISAPRGDGTRPTTDRVKESIFSALVSRLGADLGGGAALDAFAGSGALGIEALSRGCSSATFVESDRSAMTAVKNNLAALGATDRSKVVAGDVVALAQRGPLPGGPFALLLLDPPYRLAGCDIEGLTSALARNGSLEDGAVVVMEHARGHGPEWPVGFDLVSRKRYGSTEVDIVVYERGEGAT